MLRRALYLVVSICLLWSVQSAAESLSFGQDSPAKHLKENPGDLKYFIEFIEGRDDLTEIQKEAYVALATGDTQSLMGDDVLELLPAADVNWFYGFNEEVVDGQPRLFDAARVDTRLDAYSYTDCLSRTICVMVSKGSQRLYAFYRGRQIWLPGKKAYVPVSTARAGKVTPNGLFTVQELAHAGRTSNLYPGAGLFYAMQIHGHIFIHGTNRSNYPYLGSPASSGCIRTRFEVAEFLNLWMREKGGRSSGVLQDRSAVRVIVADSIPDEYLSVY